MGFLIFFPFLAAISLAFIGAFIGLLFFISACLIVIGVSGFAMNKIYSVQSLSDKRFISKFYNSFSILLGIIISLIPFGLLLYLLFSSSAAID